MASARSPTLVRVSTPLITTAAAATRSRIVETVTVVGLVRGAAASGCVEWATMPKVSVGRYLRRPATRSAGAVATSGDNAGKATNQVARSGGRQESIPRPTLPFVAPGRQQRPPATPTA